MFGKYVETFKKRWNCYHHGDMEAGNMVDKETHSPLTAHSTNKVPFILVDDFYKGRTLRGGGALCDIAPTILEILNIPVPKEMTGKSLIEPNKS